jgi:transposase
MAGLCREFGISRKTGYKIYHRYKDCGIDGLTDRSRRPYRHTNQLPMQIEKLMKSGRTPSFLGITCMGYTKRCYPEA